MIPLCRIHHPLVCRVGNADAWWQDVGIAPITVARKLWQEDPRRCGGDPPLSEPCEAKSQHGFLGIEGQAVNAIAKFVKANSR